MRYWLYMQSDTYPAELFGPYAGLDEAGNALKRLAMAAYKRRDQVSRVYAIVKGRDREAAWQEAMNLF